MILRPYQEAAAAAVFERWNSGGESALIVLPTGCGKTVIFSDIAKKCVEQGKRVLILAHRGELLEQAQQKLKDYTKDEARGIAGLECAIEKAEQTCLDSFYRVVVGSVQSFSAKRLRKFSHDYFDIIIIDEAHHSTAAGYKRVLQWFGDAKVLGVTATPDRADKHKLPFEPVYSYSINTAIKDGYLCPIRAETAALEIDLTNVKTSMGDYKEADLGNAIEPYLEQIADIMAEKCRDKKTVVFLPLVKTSKKMKDILNAHDCFKAAEVNGDSPDRSEILTDFANNKYNVLCNAMLLTEGWDCPDVDCIIILRPTKIRALYVQMLGRGLRLAKGKTELYQLDFLWQSKKFKLYTPEDIVGKENIIKPLEEKLLDEAEVQGENTHDAENTLAERLKEIAEKHAEYTDEERKERDMPSLKQAKTLRRFGFLNVDEWRRCEAGYIMKILAGNDWRVPAWITPSEYEPPSIREARPIDWDDVI